MKSYINLLILSFFMNQLSAQAEFKASSFSTECAYNFILTDIIYSDKIWDFYPIINDNIDQINGYFSISSVNLDPGGFNYLIPEDEQEKMKSGEIQFAFKNVELSTLKAILPIKVSEKTLDDSPGVLNDSFCIAHIQFTDLIKQDELFTIGIAYVRRVPGSEDLYGTYLKYDFIICKNGLPRFKMVHSNNFSKVITNWECE